VGRGGAWTAGVLKEIILSGASVDRYMTITAPPGASPMGHGPCAPLRLRLHPAHSHLLDRKAAIPSLEASLILMGIFEDTGHFRFLGPRRKISGPPPALIDAGPTWPWWRRFLVQELTPDQLGVLDAFQAGRKVTWWRLPGHPRPRSLKRYVEDIAFVVHRYVEMMGEDLFAALVEQEGKITLIAATAIPRGSGGRIFGPSAGADIPGPPPPSCRDCTLVEAKARLFRSSGAPPAARPGRDV